MRVVRLARRAARTNIRINWTNVRIRWTNLRADTLKDVDSLRSGLRQHSPLWPGRLSSSTRPFFHPLRADHCTGHSILTPSPQSRQTNASIMAKPRNTLVAPQCGHRVLQISVEASSINLAPARWRGTVSTTAPQELHLISTI